VFKNSFIMGSLALGAILVSSVASAVTVDTFDFALSTGWTRPNPPGAPVADPGASLAGSFVGVVEPDPLGTIALGDLTAFSASFTDSEGFAIGGGALESGLGTLSSFRYETLGGRRHVQLWPVRERRQGQRMRRLLHFFVRRGLRILSASISRGKRLYLNSGRALRIHSGSSNHHPGLECDNGRSRAWLVGAFRDWRHGYCVDPTPQNQDRRERSRPLASNNPPCIERAFSPQSPRSLKPG
jgi:hypothetical protein